MTYVILAMNSDMQAQIFGTGTGQPFQSEGSAERKMQKMEKNYPHLRLLVMPISDLPPLPNPLSPRMLSRADG